MVFPNDAITIYQELSGNSSTTVVSGNGDKSILSVAMQQERDLSDTILYCGSNPVAKNYGKDLSQVLMNVECNEPIILSKTGADKSNSIVTYVPYHTHALATTSPDVTSVSIVEGEYNGPNFNEWLFVAGVFLFFISFMTWARISFTKEN